MVIGDSFVKWVLLLVATILLGRVEYNYLARVPSVCEYSVVQDGKLYNFSLDSPLPAHPHGVLSEDGFYKIEANGTTLWFQLCEGMLFNHGPPRCFDCQDCRGPSQCGMKCSALITDYLGGYFICMTVGLSSRTTMNLIDNRNPDMGVIVKMSSMGAKVNCSLSVSVLCDSKGVQGPNSVQKLDTCDYAMVLMHPSGCAKVESVHGRGWGWFGTLLTICFCLFGAYLIGGTVYRYFALGIRGIEVVPNVEFWISLPIRTKIHTKKRNRLEQKRLNALVFVKYNLALDQRQLHMTQGKDPILLSELDNDNEWIVEQEDPTLPNDTSWLDIVDCFVENEAEPSRKRRRPRNLTKSTKGKNKVIEDEEEEGCDLEDEIDVIDNADIAIIDAIIDEHETTS